MNANITKGLKDLAKEFKIGAMHEFGLPVPPEESDKMKVILRDFNTITAYNYPRCWTGPYSYNFDNFNAWVNWADARGYPVIMHMISGPTQYFAPWAKEAKWNGPELDHMLYEYIRAMMLTNDNYRKVYAWNVINEAYQYNINGDYMTDEDCLMHQMGWEPDESGCTGDDRVHDRHPVYISKAFEYASRFAKGKLELRETHFEFLPNCRKTKALLQLVKHLHVKGIRCDAVGFQCHMYHGHANRDDFVYDHGAFVENVRQFKELGCEIYVTELDLPCFNGDEATQCARYEEVFKTFRRAGVDHVHFWGIMDKEGKGWRCDEAPLLYDKDFNEKATYYAVAKALEAQL